MHPKIVFVKANCEDYTLEVTFDNNEMYIFDIKTKLSQLGYELLLDKDFFRTVKVDAGGYGVSWNDEIDISEYEILITGTKKSHFDISAC